MKKLFILTVLFSVANLGAFTRDEAAARLMDAQTQKNKAYTLAKEKEAYVNQAFARAQQKPGPETYAALQAAIADHAQTVDHCTQCVHGIQDALKVVNKHGHYVRGDAWTGSIHHGAPAA